LHWKYYTHATTTKVHSRHHRKDHLPPFSTTFVLTPAYQWPVRIQTLQWDSYRSIIVPRYYHSSVTSIKEFFRLGVETQWNNDEHGF